MNVPLRQLRAVQVLNVIFFEILNMLCKNVKVYKEREFTKEATELWTSPNWEIWYTTSLQSFKSMCSISKMEDNEIIFH